MPSMYEIYEKYSENYDELVNFEDYECNLQKELNNIIKNNSNVLELGVGTGRVTKLYAEKVSKIICCDNSLHMLNKAKENLKEFNSKIIFKELDNRNTDETDGIYDLIIEGWAIGHTAIDEYDNLEIFVANLIKSLLNKLSQNGKIIFIETMGTNVEEPVVKNIKLNDFYNLIEEKYKMKKNIIKTDYKFNSISEAKRIMSFFLGKDIENEIKSNIVKEYTGIWVLEN